MKKTGTCPKCNSREVYGNQSKSKQGHRAYIGITTWSTVRVTTLICLVCGYVEEYLTPESLQNHAKLDKIRKHWKKPGDSA